MSHVGATRQLAAAAVAILFLAGSSLAACSLAGPGPTSPPLALPPTPKPAFGLTWAIAPDIELPGDAFALSSNPPNGPAHPNTAGHPGHFPGQAVIADVATSGDRLVAVGYMGIGSEWRARSWTSTDGRSWTLGSIDEEPFSFAVSVAVRPGGGFAAVGRVSQEAAAWTSQDGSTWTRASVGSLVIPGGNASPNVSPSAGPTASRSPELAERMTVVTATADGLLAGGSVGPELLGGHRARLWRSSDGRDWQPVADEADAFARSEVTAIAETPRGLVAIGYLEGGARPTASVAWIIDPGSGRSTRCDDAALAAGIARSVVATPAGLIAVGSDADDREAVAWSSVDGCTWLKAPTEPSRLHSGEKIRMTDVVVTPAGLVGVGDYVGVQYGTGTSWLSSDGLHWTMAPDQPTLGQGEPEAVVAWRDRLVIVGSRGAPDNYIPSVWLSPGLP